MLKHPETYSTGRLNSLLTPKKLFLWMLNAVFFAVFICLISYNVLSATFVDLSLFEVGTLVFFMLVHSMQCKVAFLHHQWNVLNVAGMVISLGGLFLVMFYISENMSDEFTEGYLGVAPALCSLNIFWLFGVFSIPLFVVLIDLIGYSLYMFFEPTDEMKFRELELQDKMSASFPCKKGRRVVLPVDSERDIEVS